MRVNFFATLVLLLTPLTKPVVAEVPSLVVSNFGAFLSSRKELKSHVAFTVVDPRPEYYLNTTCILSATDQQGTVALGAWKDCGDPGTDELSFWIGDDLRYLSLRRPWEWKDENG
jgi:hypothetical protein